MVCAACCHVALVFAVEHLYNVCFYKVVSSIPLKKILSDIDGLDGMVIILKGQTFPV